jgi:hypothetical protein
MVAGMSYYRTEITFTVVQAFLTFVNTVLAVIGGSPIAIFGMIFCGFCCARSCRFAIINRAEFEEPNL